MSRFDEFIEVKDTTKKDNYLISVGDVSFQCSRDEAINLANKISKMFSTKHNMANVVEPKLLSTDEYLHLKGKHS